MVMDINGFGLLRDLLRPRDERFKKIKFCNFVGRGPSRQVTVVKSLMAIGTAVVKMHWF